MAKVLGETMKEGGNEQQGANEQPLQCKLIYRRYWEAEPALTTDQQGIALTSEIRFFTSIRAKSVGAKFLLITEPFPNP